MPKKKKVKEICGNCMLFNNTDNICKIAVLVNGEEMHMPVLPTDKCHFDELGIKVEQVRWWVEDEDGKPTQGDGKVKIEYPKGFFGDVK